VGGREAAFDAAIFGLMILIVTGAPLALGAVQPPVVDALEWVCLVLVLVWVVRSVWVAPPRDAGSARQSRLSLFGHRLVSSGVELPAVLFAALVAAQLLPLPPAVIRKLSPAAAGVLAASLPGWEAGRVDFSGTGSFLAGPAGDAVVRRLLDAPGARPEGLEATAAALRPLSIYPYATARRLAIFVSLLGLFVVAVNTLVVGRRVELLTRWLVVLGFAISVFGILQRFSWNGKLYWAIDVDPAAAPFGPFINRNHFGAFVGMIIPVAGGMLLDQTRRLAGPEAGRGFFSLAAHGSEPFARLLLVSFVVAVMAGALVLSASRGALLALACALALSGTAMALRRRIGRAEAIVILGLVGAAVAVSIWLGVGPLAERLHAFREVESEPSFVSRFVGWRATMGIVAAYPVFGTGLGTFSESWSSVYPAGTSYAWHEAHNDYLQLASETGIAGVLVFLAGAGVFARRYLLPSITGARETESYASRGVGVGVLTVALHSFVDFPLQINACAVLLVTMTGLLVATRLTAEEPA